MTLTDDEISALMAHFEKMMHGDPAPETLEGRVLGALAKILEDYEKQTVRLGDPKLVTDSRRIGKYSELTGIMVRAKGPRGFGAFDIGELTRESLFAWLRSHGGANLWAENVIFNLLGHDPIKEG